MVSVGSSEYFATLPDSRGVGKVLGDLKSLNCNNLRNARSVFATRTLSLGMTWPVGHSSYHAHSRYFPSSPDYFQLRVLPAQDGRDSGRAVCHRRALAKASAVFRLGDL